MRLAFGASEVGQGHGSPPVRRGRRKRGGNQKHIWRVKEAIVTERRSEPLYKELRTSHALWPCYATVPLTFIHPLRCDITNM